MSQFHLYPPSSAVNIVDAQVQIKPTLENATYEGFHF